MERAKDLRFGQFLLKPAERQLIGPEGQVSLSARSFDILAVLIGNADQVVSKSALLDSVWPDMVVEENTLQVHMSALRKVLGEGMIATVHGRGYKYAGPRPMAAPADNGHPAGSSADHEFAARSRPSIVVLPFDNLSGDPEQTYFSDGITEDIIAELGKFKEFLVIAKNSSFRFRGPMHDVSDVANRLDVQYVVQGSVRKSGTRVRVSVQLIDASMLAHVWGEHYDRELTDIFAIQDEITQMIATRLARQARTVIDSRARARLAHNISAYELYLQALHLSAKYDDHSVRQAEPLLRQSIGLDPQFAAAHAMLGFVEVLKFFWNTDDDDLNSGLRVAYTALQLDPEEAYAHLAAGFALVYLRRFRQAESSLERALSLNPNDPFILTVNALLLCFTSRPEIALEMLDEAQRRDPFAVEWYGDFRGIALTMAGRYREAVACYEKLGHLNPWSLAYLTVCYAELGDTGLAKETFTKLRSHWPKQGIDEIVDHEVDYFEDPSVCKRFRAILKSIAVTPDNSSL